ncbi:hypothetical protein [Pseudarthrobacter polychromogenes]|uniref:Uncharacterized protein n=1 Tax=Pseudarthrobacter polychromogenes TaxID=1676 RepID=A0ABQ1Y1S0_9MICC|nr:hypothetical protein [Pseudarthrobacter polychromogenes]GGH09854.1 hypothetical protein GCM10011577_38480 [Pseudarthrobacter polychromogenes]
MTQILERPVIIEAAPGTTAGTPRGGSYITLPGSPAGLSRTEAGYISLPGGGTRTLSKAQGSYVTLHTAPLGATEISYTRRG